MTIDQSSSSRYRRLIDSGIYDDFFPLRANACFHILDKNNNGSFSLRDFIENVKYISSYLSIFMDTTSDFTIIVSFYALIYYYYYYYYLTIIYKKRVSFVI